MIKTVSLILLCLALGSCQQPELGEPPQTMQAPAPRKAPIRSHGLEITFCFGNAAGEEVPSYQTAIWLETGKGRFVKSLLVTNYLAFGGTKYPGICPDWARSADWENVSRKEFSAVTGATPPAGENAFWIEASRLGLPAGTYRYCVQTHVEEGHNILYRGTITLGSEPSEDVAAVTYSSGLDPQNRQVLHTVKARYYP